MKKNIWIICKYAFPQRYYFGTRHFYFAEEWVKQGHQVAVFTSNSTHLTSNLPKFKGSRKQENINGIETIWLNTYGEKGSASIARVLSWIHFEWLVLLTSKRRLPRPDVVYASSLSLLSVISGYIMARKYKAKFVFEVRDIWPLTPMILGGYSKWHPFIAGLRLIEKWGYKKADLIVGTMPNHIEHVKNTVSSFKKWACIPQGVSLDFYQQKQDSLTDEFIRKYIPADKFIVVYAGTMNKNNPLDALISAAQLLRDETGIHFLLIGRGDMKERIREETSAMPNVSLLDPIRKEQVGHLLSLCSVCYDSFDSELAVYGLSRNKWIDYMMSAKPIICSYNGYQSMLNEARCGEFVEFGRTDLLAATIRKYHSMSKAEIQQIGNNGRNFLLNGRQFSQLSGVFLDTVFQDN